MPDLGSVQGANKKASEYGAGRDPKSCSQLVTRPLPSLQPLATDISVHSQGSLSRRMAEDGVEAGGVLGVGRCKFSPSFDYIISRNENYYGVLV